MIIIIFLGAKHFVLKRDELHILLKKAKNLEELKFACPDVNMSSLFFLSKNIRNLSLTFTNSIFFFNSKNNRATFEQVSNNFAIKQKCVNI